MKGEYISIKTLEKQNKKKKQILNIIALLKSYIEPRRKDTSFHSNIMYKIETFNVIKLLEEVVRDE